MSGGAGPLVTTLITTYRRPALLRRAILSALEQTYPRIEVRVHDDASGDETASVVNEIARRDPRVRYLCQPRNVGPFANHIQAARQVETPYFSLLDDDDFLLPNFYTSALEAFAQHPSAMFAATRTVLRDRHGRALGVSGARWTPGYYAPPHGLLATLRHGHIPWTSTLYRRDVVEEIGCIDGNGSDMYFALRLAARWPFAVVADPGAIFHRSQDLSDSPVRRDVDRWISIVEAVRADASLPRPAKRMMEDFLMAQIGKHAFRVGLESAHRGRDAQLAAALAVLGGERRWRRAARALVLIGWVCRRSEAARRGLGTAAAVARYLRVRQAMQSVRGL